jgi:hypothetical protein
MDLFFLVCACLGGTIICCQFVLTLIGLGDSDVDLDADFDSETSVPSESPGEESHLPHGHVHGSAWLVGVLTFRTLTAAVTFFGLAGYAASTAQTPLAGQFVSGLVAGACALFGVHWLMQALVSLREDGTQRLERAVGQHGTVYLTVPAARSGSGKVQFRLQSRLVDYEAVTDHVEPLRTGSKIRVVAVVNPSTVAVSPEPVAPSAP